MKINERGITLIALIITIILLVILTAVSIRSIVGDSIITHSLTARDEYMIAQYKEQLEMLSQDLIIESSLEGKELTITSFIEKMNEEGTWIKSATLIQDSSEDIIVITKDGYKFQVYYSENYGQKFIEYIGTEENEIPNLNVEYDKATLEISIIANGEQLEIIYNEEVIQSTNETSYTYKIQNAGWYKVRATSEDGGQRYAWVRITSTNIQPNIEVTASGEKVNDWYGADGRVVEVTIENEEAKSLYYKINDSENYTSVDGTNVTLQINTVGITTVYAYLIDKNDQISEIVRLDVKYDNVKPIVNTPEVTGTLGTNNWYISDAVISLSNMADTTSGINGYYYWEVEDENNTEVQESQKTYVNNKDAVITVVTEGKHIICLQAKDRAGNVSETYVLTVSKDTVEPEDLDVTISDVTSNSFIVTADAIDSTSGIRCYDIYVYAEDGTTLVKSSVNDEDGIYAVTELSERTIYRVRVTAYDTAGNNKTVTKVSDRTLYTTYAIEYTLDGGSVSTANPTTYTSADTITLNNPSKTGYTFAGWTGTGLTSATTTVTISQGSAGNRTYTATYTAKTYTITYKDVGNTTFSGTHASGYPTSHTYGTATTLKNPTKTGYTFDGWFTNSSGTGSAVTSLGATAYTSGITLYAKWTAQGMTVAQLGNAIGKYVNYQSVIDSASSKTIYSSGTYNGSDGSLSWTRQNLTWRILDVDTSSNKVRLIAATPDTQTLTLSGANGYNNAVKILNDICSNCYSSSTLGVTARSINIEDLERNGIGNVGQGSASMSTTTSMTYHSSVPTIALSEINQWPQGTSSGSHTIRKK